MNLKVDYLATLPFVTNLPSVSDADTPCLIRLRHMQAVLSGDDIIHDLIYLIAKLLIVIVLNGRPLMPAG